MAVVGTATFAVAAVLGSTMLAHDYAMGDLFIAHPYVFETADVATSGTGYFSVKNNGSTSDRLIAIELDSGAARIQEMTVNSDGLAQMRPAEGGLEIPSGGSVRFGSRGAVVLFTGLSTPFTYGERVPATLVFARAGEVHVEFAVQHRSDGFHSMEHPEVDERHDTGHGQ